jgi:hypothetical protein
LLSDVVVEIEFLHGRRQTDLFIRRSSDYIMTKYRARPSKNTAKRAKTARDINLYTREEEMEFRHVSKRFLPMEREMDRRTGRNNGTNVGATTSHFAPILVSCQYSAEPVGPAS